MTTTYAYMQMAKDSAYQAELKRHLATLSLEEQEKWAEMGLDRVDGRYKTGRTKDISEREDLEATSEANYSDDVNQAALRCLIAEILAAKNAKLVVECMALVSGIVYDGDTEADIARRHGVTRAAVSKICKAMMPIFGLNPRASLRKLTTCKRNAHATRNAHIAADSQLC